MAEEILVKEALTTEKIEGGKLLTELLDKTDLEITASFWFYFIDAQKWNLILGISQVMKEGSLKSIAKIQKVFEKNQFQGIDFLDVIVLQSDHPIIKRLMKMATTGKTIKGIRISQSVIDGVFIQDAYIYRLIKSIKIKKVA